ncbi:unnamed protein product [Trichobilharzia szidati]|nr:unnamed protein product [Trichobilharzia szidati]
MKIKITVENFVKTATTTTTTTIIIMIINNILLVNTESWQNTLLSLKRDTHSHSGRNSMTDVNILKMALDNYARKINSHKNIEYLSQSVNLTQSYAENFTDHSTDLDHQLMLSNYSSDANTLADDSQEHNLKTYFSDQKDKHSRIIKPKGSTMTSVHVMSSKYDNFNWNILKFSFGLLCFIVHMIWFIWLLYHGVLVKLCNQSTFHQLKPNQQPLNIINDLPTRRQQLTLRAELHLSFVGTIYGFIMSIRRISNLILDSDITQNEKQSNLDNRNYFMCYLTRHISLGVLTVYWITLLIIILINIHYMKSVTLMNSPKLPLIRNTFIPLYIVFIISWIFSLVIRMGSLLINYNLQKFTLKRSTDSRHSIMLKHALNFECINTKELEHQKMYFYTVCHRTTFEQWLEILTNILCDILPNFLVFTVSIFICFLAYKSSNINYKLFDTNNQISQFMLPSNGNNNNNNDTTENESNSVMRYNETLKNTETSPIKSTDSRTHSPEVCSLSTSCLTYQCELPSQPNTNNNNDNQQTSQQADNILLKQKVFTSTRYNLHQIIHLSISLIILSLCLLLNHILRLIIYGKLMKSQINYCHSWNFNQGLHEPENIELFKLVHENLHIPQWYLNGCLLVEIVITICIPVIFITQKQCLSLLSNLSCMSPVSKRENSAENKTMSIKQAETDYIKPIKSDDINLCNLTLPITSYISSTPIDNPLSFIPVNTTTVSSTLQCSQTTTDTIIPPCELLKLQMFTRAQFEKKINSQITDTGYHFNATLTSLPTCSNEASSRLITTATTTTTTLVPVSIKLVNLQPFCCQPCDIFTSNTIKLDNKGSNNHLIDCELLNNNNSDTYPVETTASIVKLHVLSDSSGFDE